MEPSDWKGPPPPSPGGSGAAPLLVCSVVGLVAAVVLCAGLLAQHGSWWLAIGAGLAVFPFLPLVWHGLADQGTGSGGARGRFALRSLAVALLVLLVSVGDLGPKRVGQNLRALGARIRAKPAAKPGTVPFLAQAKFHGLESFLPADASLAVGLAGSAAVQQILGAHGVDTRAQLAALGTCKIDFANARILVAARGRETHQIVVRAPGLGDERNLYCLVGVLGQEHVQLKTDGNVKTLQVTGLRARPLLFRSLDLMTLIATDENWRDTAEHRLFGDDLATARGRLALPLLRVDRTTPLWVVSVDESAQGVWDLAVDSRQEGDLFKLQGSSTPPSGEADRAHFSVRVPLAFAGALPESAVALGIRGVVAAVAATSVVPILPMAATKPPSAPPEAKRPGIDAGAGAPARGR